MDKLDEYNIKQIQLAYPEHQSILTLIRVLKEAKVDKGKDIAYIQELEEKLKKFQYDKNLVSLIEYSNFLDRELTQQEINNIAKVEIRKEELYIELTRNCKALETKLINNGIIKSRRDRTEGEFILFKRVKQLDLEINTLIKYITNDN